MRARLDKRIERARARHELACLPCNGIFHTLYLMLYRAHVLSSVVLTTVVEMIEILDGRVGIVFS